MSDKSRNFVHKSYMELWPLCVPGEPELAKGTIFRKVPEYKAGNGGCETLYVCVGAEGRKYLRRVPSCLVMLIGFYGVAGSPQ